MFSDRHAVRLPSSAPPRLVALVDVEEEFDWDADFDRGATRFAHLDELEQGLDALAGVDIVPVGVITYPVVEDDAVAARLERWVADGRMIVGAHLHPWVTPPYDEVVDRRNSFPGNLPKELEGAKLAALTARLEERVGERPRVYQAGRYGAGPNTAALLAAEGYTVGMSVNPPFDFSPQGGPDYSREGATPFWHGERSALLELPITGAFVGWAGAGGGRMLHRLAATDAMTRARLGGLLARVRAVERIRLSPEGQSLADMQRLTRALLARGERVFVLSFHSPSLAPGCTEYVRDAEEREAFLARCTGYARWFVETIGGETSTPLEVRETLLREAPPPTPRGEAIA
ncbi:MAG: hypothetical protein ACF8XB_15590 [Planctomycetota bacterium JB042]